ncbi:MAG: response regulator transcription factor [Clostridia bacterium]|nr:response regulator transcription factor [Clostridia bacterium]
MTEKIMIIDDEPDIIFLLRDFFLLNDYDVITAENAEEATAKFKENPDLILLDINMPGKNGLEFCKQIRAMTQCPIIFLSARTNEDDILAGLNVGGDDYITKPFHIRELLGRVQAHLRREKRNKDDTKNNGLKIDYAGMHVTFNGNGISFTKTEFEIIEYLSLHPGQVFSREKIYENVIGLNSEGDNTVITEHIRRIRNKFNGAGCESYIETVWGLGYRWIK